VQEQAFKLSRDPMVAMTDVEIAALHTFRLNVAKLQRSVRDRVAQFDSLQRRFAEVKTAADSAANAPAAAKTEAAAIETELTQIAQQIGATVGGGRGGRGRGGRGGAGGRGAGGAGADQPPEDLDPAAVVAQAQTVANRLGSLGEMLNGTYNPSPEQKATAVALPAEVQKQAERITNVSTVRLPALIKALKDAGVTVAGQ
jgi:hypothetical protein